MATILFLTFGLYLLISQNNNSRSIQFFTLSKQNNNLSIFANHKFDTSLILELILSALNSGVSIPRCLEIIGQKMNNSTGRELKTVSKKLKLGDTWTSSWKSVSPSLQSIGSALEDAWQSGTSPTTFIKLKIDQLQKDKLYKAKTAGEQLSVKIVLPLGACFLPSFIFIGIIPVIMSLIINLF
jgi:pilus assembly protein TadC